MSTQNTLSMEHMRADIARLLGVAPSELAEDQSLLEQGLDSIRMMALVERWRAAGAAITFAELAEHVTLQAWHKLISTPKT